MTDEEKLNNRAKRDIEIARKQLKKEKGITTEQLIVELDL